MKPTIALKTYFGMKEGQTLLEFSTECKNLRALMDDDAYTAFINAVGVQLGFTIDWS